MTITPEREELRAVVRKFLATHSSEQHVRSQIETDRGFDGGVWKQMAEQIGVQSLVIPEEYGGAGFSFGELAIVLEEAGRSLVCAPLFSTCVLATYALMLAEDVSEAGVHLPGIAEGRTVATVALLEDDGHWTADGVQTRATATEHGFALTGVKRFVLDGADADLLIVAARTDAGVSLFTVDANAEGVQATAVSTLDPTRRQATISLVDANARLLGVEGNGWNILSRVLDVAAAALACEQVGGAAQVLEATVDYVKIRKQFGRQIGSFQAVKHSLADMLVELESARSAAYFASDAVDSGSSELAVCASIAKVYCSTAYYHIAAESIQLHGGIGFTWEHPAHLYFKRAKGSETLLGSPAFHRELIAQRVGI
ncbi:acyl-CoA dehydrogenase family protein [Rhodococcoides fascians]|uniref:acyl-CoA dehydrogenase family protein n=1 Tax=Rhodococcoides fascians TaxID=1828 RepID=UPI000AC3EF71|nr:acyl-CoA dehydrogenase family protein [Rhodococcus fascians]